MRDLRFGAEDHIVMFIAQRGTCRTQPNLVLRHSPRTRNRTPNTSAPKPEVPTAELTSRWHRKNNGRYTHPYGNGAPRKQILATAEPRRRRSTKSSQDKNGSTHSTCCDLLHRPMTNPSQKSKKVRRIITVHYKHRVNIGLHNTRVL